MIRVMFDSDTIADLPRNAPGATYADLIHDTAQLDNLRAEFPYGLLLIDRNGDPLDVADALDVETGLHSVSDARAWLEKRKKQGRTGRLYCNRSTLPALDAATQGINHLRWIATLDGTMHITGFNSPHTPAAIQFANSDMLGFHCDASIIYQDAFLPAPEVWQGSNTLLAGMQTILGDLENCIAIIKRHA